MIGWTNLSGGCTKFAMRLIALIVLISALPLLSFGQLPPLDWHLQARSDIERLKHGDQTQQKLAMFSLHQNAANAIPLLIELIDDRSPFEQITLKNPKLSGIPEEALHKTYMGVLAAYTVELILGTEKLRGDRGDSSFLVDPQDCVYDYGILHIDGGKITRSDLAKVKGIYQEWWNTHKDKSLQELRQEWKENKRPLSGTAYSWW